MDYGWGFIMKFFTLPLLVLVTTLFIGCCDSTDYSEIVREVAKPMLKELDSFYKKNKRHPSVEERDKMLKKAGCEMNGDKCLHDREEILIETDSYAGSYSVGMTLKKTYCNFTLRDSGELSSIRCYNNPCVKLGQ